MYILAHKPEWKSIYLAESEKIRREIGSKIELHHIGSTSVVGLWSKNCIDILGVVESFQLGKDLIKPLEDLGFIYKGEYGIVDRHYFTRPMSPKLHLHICPIGHEQIDRHLHFVRLMKSNAGLVKELNELKRKLAEKYSKEVYQQEKKAYYEKILSTKL